MMRDIFHFLSEITAALILAVVIGMAAVALIEAQGIAHMDANGNFVEMAR